MGYEGPLPYSQEPATGPCPQSLLISFHRCPVCFRTPGNTAVLHLGKAEKSLVFYLKTETEYSFRNVVFCNINRTVFLDKDRTIDNVQKHNICTVVFCWIPGYTDLLRNEAAGTAPVLRNFTPDRAFSSDIRVCHLCPVLLW
jgi:hypothetical protein